MISCHFDQYGGKCVYRLLIVTENQSVRDLFTAMEGWESMGFKPPRLRQTTQEALECMQKHQIDAIAVDNDPAFDELNRFVEEKCPAMLRFPIDQTPDVQWKIIRALDRMLGNLHADHFNDEYDLMSSLSHSQERLLKGIVCGLIPTEEELKRRLFMLRCSEKPNVPCVLARLTMDTDDPFLTSRWHYGSERLETALRNFFGVRQRDMYLHVAVISPEEVRVLCYPVTEDGTLLESAVRSYVKETAQQVDHYLGLHMEIAEVRLLPGLSAFAAENLK